MASGFWSPMKAGLLGNWVSHPQSHFGLGYGGKGVGGYTGTLPVDVVHLCTCVWAHTCACGHEVVAGTGNPGWRQNAKTLVCNVDARGSTVVLKRNLCFAKVFASEPFLIHWKLD